MNITEIAFVSYAVTDVKRAREFYEGVLELKPASVFEQGSMAFIEYWIGKGNEHCLVIGAGAENMKPGLTGATAALEVEDFKKAIEHMKSKNAPFLMEPYETSVCHMAIVKDSDGNQIMIHQRK